jgi:peptidoglycan/xylan/chitin deacetylase (PgdA/CDA1 family)
MKPISLLYHDVVSGDLGTSGFAGADADSYKLDERQFINHLERIRELGMGHVQLFSKSRTSDDELIRPLFLTFDDGGVTADVPTSRLLEARGWRGHFFIVTAKVDQPGFLTSVQIRDLHLRGHHIGSHSHTHPAQFSKLRYSQMLAEWQESRRILTKIIGQPTRCVSVPGGFYSSQVARAAREAGYEVLFNSEPTSQIRDVEGLIIIGRYGIKRNTPARDAQSIARGDFAPRALQSLVWNLKKPAKKMGGKAWFSMRRLLFERSTRPSKRLPSP